MNTSCTALRVLSLTRLCGGDAECNEETGDCVAPPACAVTEEEAREACEGLAVISGNCVTDVLAADSLDLIPGIVDEFRDVERILGELENTSPTPGQVAFRVQGRVQGAA